LVATFPDRLAGGGVERRQRVGVLAGWLVERVHEPVGDDRGAVGLADRQPPGRLQLALPRLDLLRAGAVAVGAEELRPVGGGEGGGGGERGGGRGQAVE